ncbi:propanediol dehydratase medium subunit [Vallitalea longa]|uniref:Propanediol dehydratase medium subunit n=1 Tax=Vallitalea longa TaxID=2936439 RepID=A0A9W6DE93_9FIRM|nr:propanediol/glycerol family dehydratase medium subunit [Vallitalea longa]GKX28173.1 propanediol dehydratase medium subunit [Vallitalea longa]
MEVTNELIEQITKLVVKELSNKRIVDKEDSKDIHSSIFEHIQKSNRGMNRKEVVIGVGPAFGSVIKNTINNLEHEKVIKEIMAGVEEEGMVPRVIKVYKTSDVAFIGKEAANMSGSGVSVGIQSKGTALIHQKDLYPLTNLELFPQAPLLTLDIYRQIGKNAARYAKGVQVKPIESKNDFTVRAKYQVKAALMHTRETEYVDNMKKSIDIRLSGVC